jgi:hypothetical protein
VQRIKQEAWLFDPVKPFVEQEAWLFDPVKPFVEKGMIAHVS